MTARTPPPSSSRDVGARRAGENAGAGSQRRPLRRFTRLSNAFSKKIEHHVYALAIYFMHYNFVRIHQTTRVTPAMAAGVTDTLWELTDIVRVVDEWEKTK